MQPQPSRTTLSPGPPSTAWRMPIVPRPSMSTVLPAEPGTAILDLCRSDGIQTIAGASSDEKCAFAASLGTIGTVNYSRENIAEKVLEITAGRGVDISFDQLGGDALTNSLSMMAPLGLVVLYNALLGAPSEDLFDSLARTPRATVWASSASRCIPTTMIWMNARVSSMRSSNALPQVPSTRRSTTRSRWKRRGGPTN